MSKIPKEIQDLTDDQLRQEIINHKLSAGPITDTTRKAYQNRLASVWGGGSGAKKAPVNAPAPKRSPKKQSVAAISSEEEDEEEVVPTPRPSRHATPPARKSFLPVSPVLNPVVSITPDKKKPASKVTKRIARPVVPTYDTGSDSDGPAENQTHETSRTTHTYWRQSLGGQSSTPSSTPLSASPYMSNYGRQLSLAGDSSSTLFNGHSSRVEALKKMAAHRPEVIEQSWTHKFFTKLLPVLLALFFCYLAYCYMGMQANPQEVSKKVDPFLQNVEQDPDTQFPVCKGTQVPGINCILSGDARPALDSLRILAPTIKQKYVEAVCGSGAKPNEGPAGAVDFDELEKILEARGISDPESVMNNIRVLIRHNAKWGLEIVNQGKSVIMTNASLPVLCFLKQKATDFASVFIIVVALGAGVGAIIYIYKAFTARALREEAIKTELINRIKDRMESTESNGSHLPINELKQELLGENNFNSMQKAWDFALARVLVSETRIRMEVKMVGGEEVDCLVWIPSQSPKQSDKSIRQTRGTNAKTFEKTEDASLQSSRDHPGMWQGQAFENVEGSFNSPPVSPTQCLKIRQMFVPDRPSGSDGVIDAIMEKCGQNVNILHIKLDRNAAECCVYMKTASQADAGRAFKALHGWWFDGNLVTVKFLRLERYHERFPESIQACIPLRSTIN